MSRSHTETLLATSALVVSLWLGSTAGYAEDCNQNGIDDEIELLGDLSFAAARSCYTFSQADRIISGDFDNDGQTDLIANEPVGITSLTNVGRGAFARVQALFLLQIGQGDALDADGDGDLDLVIPFSSQKAVTLLLNDGTGRFTTGGSLDVGSNPTHARVHDVNGDGHLDIIALNNGSKSISIILNNGDGTFKRQTAFTTENTPLDLLIGDLDGDFDTDILVVTTSGITILRNDGNGSFADRTTMTLGNRITFATLADVNGDGFLDLLATIAHLDLLSIFLNDGHGAFPSQEDVLVDDRPVHIVANDWDRDGDIDVVVHVAGSRLQVLSNDGLGGFSDTSSFARGCEVFSLLGVDVDSDGFPDIIASNEPSGFQVALERISTFLNDGEGTFIDCHNVSLGDINYGLAVADFNGDDLPDVAATSFEFDRVTVAMNDGRGGFLAPTEYYLRESAPRGIAAADFDGDGDVDLVVCAINGFYLMRNDGSGDFSDYSKQSTQIPVLRVAAADFDGDGDVDIATTSDTCSLTIWKNDGSGKFGGAKSTGINCTYDVAEGDVDLDGDTDLVVTGGHANIMINNGSGVFSKTQSKGISGHSVRLAEIADLNGDAFPEIVVATMRNGGGKPVLGVFYNAGDGTYEASSQYSFGEDDDNHHVLYGLAIADVTLDGHLDVVVANYTLDKIYIFANNGDGSLAPAVNYATGSFPVMAAAADIDADGREDVIVATHSGASLLFNNGRIPAPDCNANGRPDDCDILDGHSDDINGNGIPDECETAYGDLNCDGSVSPEDIDSFVLAIISPEEYQDRFPDCLWSNGDINRDGFVNFSDIDPFVECIINNGCP
jgi:hypothetical protein